MSAVKVTAEFYEQFSISVSPEIVRRAFRAVILNGRSVSRKVSVSAKNIKFRLLFAKSMINKLETYWNIGLFADESKFSILVSGGRIIV